jgi:hypothetical protein
VLLLQLFLPNACFASLRYSPPHGQISKPPRRFHSPLLRESELSKIIIINKVHASPCKRKSRCVQRRVFGLGPKSGSLAFNALARAGGAGPHSREKVA